MGRKSKDGLCAEKKCRLDRDHQGACDRTMPGPDDGHAEPPTQSVSENFTEAKRKAKAKGREKKTPAQKRAATIKERESWTQGDIDEAFTAAGGIPKERPEHPGPGQPSKIFEIDLERVESLAAGGLTKTEIAESLGISQATRKSYQKKYPAFLAAIRRGKARNVKTAVNSLHKLANGYTIPEEKVFFDGQTGAIVRAQVLTHYKPDAKALHLILQHSETKSWKPKGDMNHTGEVGQKHSGAIGFKIDTTDLQGLLNGSDSP